MTQETAIATRSHGMGLPQQRHHRIANRGRLPGITIEGPYTEEHLADFSVRRSSTLSVEGPERAA